MPLTDRPLSPDSGVSQRLGVALVLFAWVLQLYAIWSPTYLPLVDLPNHMARHYLECLYLTGSDLPPFYAIEPRVLPNLGADLIVPPLLTILEPTVACKVFVTLAVLLYWLGPALFLQQCGQERSAAFAVATLLLPWTFSPALFWGFLNYYSGMGVCFLTLTHYLHLSRQQRTNIWQLLAHALLVCLLFLWHLAPWVIYGIAVASHMTATIVGRWRTGERLLPALRKIALLGLATVPSLALFAWYFLQNHGAHPGVNPGAVYNWGGWGRKALGPLRFLRGYDMRIDLVAGGLWAAAVFCCFGMRIFRGWHWHWLHLCLALMLACYLVLPFELGSTSDADSRLLPAMLVCLGGTVTSLPVQRVKLTAALLGACLLLRCGSVAMAWQRHSRHLEDQAAAFAHLEKRSRVLPVILLPEWSKNYPEFSFMCWAVPAREVFMPTLFAMPDQQPLRLLPPYASYDRGMAGSFTKDRYEVSPSIILGCYDYVWLYNPMSAIVRMPDFLEPVFNRNGLTVWRVRTTAVSAASR